MRTEPSSLKMLTTTKAYIETPHWYAIYTKSRFEKKIFTALQKKSIQAFLPLLKEKRRWSDRIKTIQVPMLPSYVFVRLCESQFTKLYYLPGFVRLVSFEGKPCIIKAKEIELMEQITRHGLAVKKANVCEIGDVVRIVNGPLKGWEGTIEQKMGKDRILFYLDGVQQVISIAVEAGDVERIG